MDLSNKISYSELSFHDGGQILVGSNDSDKDDQTKDATSTTSIGERIQHCISVVQLPSISFTLFHTDHLATLMQQSLHKSINNMEHPLGKNNHDNNNHPPTTPPLKFSSREPAVNVYTPGGECLAHNYAQALTLLVFLSSSSSDDKDAGNYVSQGGGTAFWSQEARGHRVEAPSLIVTPKEAGTALLFGGCVTHADLPVTEGSRVVFVASFS